MLGLVFSFLNPTIGLLLGVLGIIGSALFVFFKGLGQKEAGLRLKEQRGKLNGIMATIDKLQQEIDDLRVQRQEVQSYLSDACNKLGLHQPISPKGILEYYRTLSDIQQLIVKMDEEEKDIKDQSFELAEQIEQVDMVISELENSSDSYAVKHLNPQRDVLQLDIWQDIQVKLKRWYELMNTAVQLNNITQEINKVRNKSWFYSHEATQKEESEQSEDVTIHGYI